MSESKLTAAKHHALLYPSHEPGRLGECISKVFLTAEHYLALNSRSDPDRNYTVR